MLLRLRLTSFLAGAAIAGGAALYQLRQDIWDSHSILAQQTEEYEKTLERRINSLEARLSQLQGRN